MNTNIALNNLSASVRMSNWLKYPNIELSNICMPHYRVGSYYGGLPI